MLTYFLNHSSIDSVREIIRYVNRLKENLIEGNYTECVAPKNHPLEAFQRVKDFAKESGDEQLANSAYVFQEYIKLWLVMGKYFSLLDEHLFAKSWNSLQDCFDSIKFVGRNSDEKYDLYEVRSYLENYESLYPYTAFASSEYIISKSHCSICGKSMQSLECFHRRGELYWGECATEIVDEIKTLQAVCVVQHPEDKRCVLTVSDDNRTEEEKFGVLNSFLNLGIKPLTNFEVRSETAERKKYPHVYRNDPCPCGSGKKYKFCCGKSPYYMHVNYTVHKEGQLELTIFKI